MAQIQFTENEKGGLSGATFNTNGQRSRVLLQTFSELLGWRQEDNQFIETGYRYCSALYFHAAAPALHCL